MKYTTSQGDMWDIISLVLYGSERYKNILIKHNPKYKDVYIFDLGVELEAPEIDVREQNKNSVPWRRVQG